MLSSDLETAGNKIVTCLQRIPASKDWTTMPAASRTPLAFEDPPEPNVPSEGAALPFYGRVYRAAHARRAQNQRSETKLHTTAPTARRAKTGQSDDVQGQLNSRLHDALRSAVDWLWETGAQMVLTSVAPATGSKLRIPPPFVTGRKLSDICQPKKGAKDPLMEAVDARRPFRVEVASINLADGSEMRCRLTGVPYFDSSTGGFAGYRGTGTAMGDAARPHVQDPEFVEQLRGPGALTTSAEAGPKQAIDQQDNLGPQECFASVAHELRTPLNAILGLAEMIMDRHLGKDIARYQEYGQCIHDSGVHLLELLDSLLGQSATKDDRQSLEFRALDVAELTEGALRIVKDEAQQANVALVNELCSHLPKVHGDRRAVRQILLNLLTNAIKYTPREGSVGIEGEGVLKLTVWDSGVGIAPEDQEKVFQKSYRAPEVRLDKPGKGLGLAISRELARAMHGEITIDSRPGEGSRVSLWLPLDNAPPRS